VIDPTYIELMVVNTKNKNIVTLLDMDTKREAIQFKDSLKGSEFKGYILNRSTASVFDSVHTEEEAPALAGIEDWS
jgi:hypothetical protein